MALDQQKIAAVEQAKLNCICNKLLHTRDLPKARWYNNAVDAAGFIIPILMVIATVSALQLHLSELAITITANVLTGIIFALTSIKLYYGWQKNVEDHATLLAENISVIREASLLLDRRASASNAEAEWFLCRYDDVERKSTEVYGELPKDQQQEYYRKALKEFDANARCRTCNASPFQFTPGPCQTCGGTPVAMQEQTHESSGR